MQKVLFIGASGMLGKPVALELMRSGFPVTFLGRDVDKLRKLFPNAAIVKGDVFDVSSLETAMTGHEIVYANLSVAQSSKKSDPQPEREGVANIIEAAKKSGVKRIVYLSSLIKNYQGMNGFSWWSFELKQAAVDAIKKSGLNYSIFYASTFMETLDRQMLQGKRLMVAGRSEAPMWFIAGKDYGVQVAWALKKAGDSNQEYSIQGLEPFTFDEAAKVFIQNVKTPIKIMKAPLAPLKYLGLVNQRVNYAYHICEALNKYPEKFESENAWNDLGKPSTTLADYAASLKL
ncbi:MAG TPA: NAD(P)H-binding protein [Chitinophagaceae bacterium]|nr:NAD(P)H-binding protein [Chitinophagaceae bacterium]